jgi:D-xylose transport system permease protein
MIEERSMAPAPEAGPPAAPSAPAWSALRRILAERVRGGEWGAAPVVVGMVVIMAVFGSLNDRFLSAENLANLALQLPATGMIALGVISVLLLGEVDLSAGAVSGLCAVVMTVLAVRHGLPPLAAVGAAVLCGAAIGALHGLLFTRVGIPSFVVTLAGLIGWQGVMLRVLGHAGTVNLPFEGVIARLSDTWLTGAAAWALGVGAVAVFTAFTAVGRARRRAAGLPTGAPAADLARVALLAAVVGLAIAVLTRDRGVPLNLVVFVGAVVGYDLVLRLTVFGRHVYAVGGSAEAARRAGIDVTRVRMVAFAISSALAAVGGILGASRLAAVNQSSGGSDLLLNAIAAAVIGGVSLFGGRGRTYAALLGVLVIQSISNGMLLLSVDSSVRFMVTAVVLVAAVATDSLARRRQPAAAR